MGKSERVRFADLRQAYRLIHECRDLGHDVAAWSRHAVEQITRLIGTQIGIMAEPRFGASGELLGTTLLHDHGWSSPRQRAFWYQHYIVEREYARGLTFQRFTALSAPLLTRSREQLVDDTTWYRSAEFQEMHRQWEADDLLASVRRWDNPPHIFGLTLARSLGERKHGGRERRLVHLFMDELSRYLGKSLALPHEDLFAALSPRLRQTLECLLEGDSEKQVAARLGLSRHTVHQYVTDLYRRLGVSSRAELLALCLRRRP
jgi:DNA-binding CsgD family transcriptional regulator